MILGLIRIPINNKEQKMKLHLECERTIHFQKVDGKQGVLKEGAQAYMHFITSKKIDIWMRATV